MIHRLTALALVLLLAVTAGAMAVARGQGAVAGWAEICTGSGPVMVALDADGNPAGAANLCPDAALFLADGVPAPIPPRLARLAGRMAAARRRSGAGRPAPAARARGPPAAV